MKFKAKHRRQCAEKVRHETEEDAKRMAWLYGRHVYRCPICDKWHVTSKEQRS
jgi:hypothetical protein